MCVCICHSPPPSILNIVTSINSISMCNNNEDEEYRHYVLCIRHIRFGLVFALPNYDVNWNYRYRSL